MFHFQAAFIAALSKGYAQWKRYNSIVTADGTPYLPRTEEEAEILCEYEPITVDELTTLSLDEFTELFGEAAAVFADDGKTTVDTKPAKKKEAEAGASA